MLVNIVKIVFVALLWRQTADLSPEHCHDGEPDESELATRHDGEPDESVLASRHDGEPVAQHNGEEM